MDKDYWKHATISNQKDKEDIGKHDVFTGNKIKETIYSNLEHLKTLPEVTQGKGIFVDENFEKKFNLTGSFTVTNLETLGAAKNFFTEQSGRYFKKTDGDTVEYSLRGPRYIVARDCNLSVRQKLGTLRKDLEDGMAFLANVQGEEKDQYTELAPVLDYMKNSLSTVLNGYLYDEKIGNFHFEDVEFQRNREVLVESLRKISYAYYGALLNSLGADEKKQIIEMEFMDAFNDASKKIKKNFTQHLFPPDAISRPELTHPLVMMGSIGMLLSKHPDTDTVVGLPSGGTEIACALAETYERRSGKDCHVVLLPISHHTLKEISGNKNGDLRELVAHHYLELHGKNVVLIDDNSSTGLTMQEARNIILEKSNPESIFCSVAEADIIRSRLDAYSEKRLHVANPKLYDLSVNILPVSKMIRAKQDIKEIMETNQLINMYLEKAETAETMEKKILYEVFADDLANPTEVILEKTSPEERIEKFQGTFISNFYATPVQHNSIEYPSVEHAYQAAKFDHQIIKNFSEENKEILREQFRVKGYGKIPEDFSMMFTDPTVSAGMIKNMATKLREMDCTRDTWDDERIEIMIQLLLEKYKNPVLREKLLATEGKYLLEGNTWNDTLWGIYEGKGRNLLGRIIMNIREKIKEQDR